MIYGDKIDSKNSYTGAYPLSFKYLHGELEEKNGYDICYSNNEEEAYILNNEEGVFDIEVCILNPDSTSTIHKAKAYVWLIKDFIITKGLIVSINDKNAIKYAEKCYKEKKCVI